MRIVTNLALALLLGATTAACGEGMAEPADPSETIKERIKSYSQEVEILCGKLDAEYVPKPRPLCIKDGEVVFGDEN